MNDIIAKIYGAGGERPARGDTIGGIGNTAAMGENITWSKASTGTAREGQVVNTPAGKYVVVMTDNGLALEPQEGALRDVESTVQNITDEQHHVGINPETGDIWYQKALSIPSQFSGSMAAQQSSTQTSGNTYIPSFCASGWEDEYGNCVDPPPTITDGSDSSPDTITDGSDSSGGSGLFGAGGSSYSGGVTGLGYLPQEMMPVAQAPKIDYAKMLNQALAESMFGSMI